MNIYNWAIRSDIRKVSADKELWEYFADFYGLCALTRQCSVMRIWLRYLGWNKENLIMYCISGFLKRAYSLISLQSSSISARICSEIVSVVFWTSWSLEIWHNWQCFCYRKFFMNRRMLSEKACTERKKFLNNLKGNADACLVCEIMLS